MRRTLLTAIVLAGLTGCAISGADLPASTPQTEPSETVVLTPQDSGLSFAWRGSSGELRRVELATGDLVNGAASLDTGSYMNYALAPDGARIAVYRSPENGPPEDSSIILADPTTLQEIASEKIALTSTIDLMAFSPDGHKLAATHFPGSYKDTSGTGPHEHQISLIDADRPTITGQTTIDFSPRLLRFSPDGGRIVVYGTRYNQADASSPAIPRLAVIDAGDLRTVWDTPIEGLMDGSYTPEGSSPNDFTASTWWQPAVVFSGDGNRLYIVHADVERLTTADLAKEAIATVDISPRKTFMERLMGFGARVAHAKAVRGTTLNVVLSADGARLIVVGEARDVVADKNTLMQFTSEPLDLRVIDTASGALLESIETQATNIARSADGSRLFLYRYDSQGGVSTEILDGATLESLATVDDLYVHARALTLAGGRRVLLAERWTPDGRAVQAVLDAGTFSQIAEWTDRDTAGWVVAR